MECWHCIYTYNDVPKSFYSFEIGEKLQEIAPWTMYVEDLFEENMKTKLMISECKSNTKYI